MEFRTIINLKESETKIAHQDKILMLGSCFSDNIGNRLKQDMFNVDINPFGTLYNPLSIAQSLNRLLDKRVYQEDDLFLHNNLWLSFEHHSSFSSTNRGKMLEKINSRFEKAMEFLDSAKILIVTFGTAYIYSLAKSHQIVSNCHKLPASNFERRLASVYDILEVWEPLINKLIGRNPQLQIIFTVSPIRHLADGAHKNQLSKSTLLFAENELIKKFECCKYFPAYEIMLDDLRDYRFYANDMVHPSDMAVEYIYKKFADCFCTEQTIDTAKECSKLYKRIKHRPLTDDLKSIEEFQKSTEELKSKLFAKYPYLKELRE